jgi:hypothetical protein
MFILMGCNNHKTLNPGGKSRLELSLPADQTTVIFSSATNNAHCTDAGASNQESFRWIWRPSERSVMVLKSSRFCCVVILGCQCPRCVELPVAAGLAIRAYKQ